MYHRLDSTSSYLDSYVLIAVKYDLEILQLDYHQLPRHSYVTYLAASPTQDLVLS